MKSTDAIVYSNLFTIKLPGYQISEVIYAGSKTTVYRGQQEKNQLPVAIKTLNTENPILQDLVSLKNQFAITQQLEHENIIKSHGLEPYGKSYALILEDFQGITLTQYANSQPLSLQEFFPIAIAITEALDYLYQQKVIHKDIKPKNILINPETKQIKLIDFGISSLLPKETSEIKNPNLLRGTLAYMSPEQTGRMNRGIDYRTDFYSLGVTFYELFTGQLPFNHQNPLELVYSHLAQEPRNPREINPHLPEIVADIILKLMAKTAERRYQTAKGIKHDLGICQQMLFNQGEITAFKIAQRDNSDRFLIPEKLYGRETEAKTLLNTFERVSKGSKELMLVAGFSGIGKTAVVNEVHKPIVRQKGYFISGKYDQFQSNIPFSAFVQAFHSLLKQLLTESTSQLQDWKTKILEALGEQAGVIIEIIPELEKIIGKQPEIVELTGNAAQNRFNFLFSKFIQVFATAAHPLVIFLDDLQWSDPGSLQLIQLLMSEADLKYLLLICAYRDNEITIAHPFKLTLDNLRQSSSTINQINLQPLEQNHLNLLIADTLNCSESKALSLTQLIFNKTQGNPLFTNQILKSLYEDGLIIFDYDHNYWHFDLARSESLYLNNDIVDFLKTQLLKLPARTQNILKIAACIGNQFDLHTLAIVAEQSLAEIVDDLWPALEEGIIISQNEVYKLFTNEQLLSNLTQLDNNESEQLTSQYKFLHDRVQQAAYSLIPVNDKQATHLKIGQLILQNANSQSVEEKIFEIINQLNFGLNLITNLAEKYELAKLNLIAGKKAKSATAYQAAIKYLTVGLELLATDSWQSQYELTLDFHKEIAEVEYLSGNFEKAIEVSNQATQYSKQILDKVSLYQIQMQSYIAQNLQNEAVEIGIQVLKKLGVHLPNKATKLSVIVAVIQTKLSLFCKQPDDLLTLPNITDPYKLAAVKILSNLIPAASQAGSSYFPLYILAMLRLSIRYGKSPLASFAYTIYGAILCDKFLDIETGYKFGKLGCELLEKFSENSLQSKIHYIFNFLIRQFKEPIKATLAELDAIIENALKAGDIEYVGYCCWNASLYLLLSRDNLEQANQKTLKYLEILQSLKLEATYLATGIIQKTILNFQGYSSEKLSLANKELNETAILATLKDNPYCCSTFYFCKTFLNYLFNNYCEAIITAELAEKYHEADPGFIHYSVNNYYHSLALLAQYNSVSFSERKQYLRQVETNQKKMKIWAHHAPCNFQNKYNLVEAEKARVLGKNWQAGELYSQAIKGARENGYLQEEAIGNELAAKFYLEEGREEIAQAYLINAYHCYKNWGAKAKVEDLENSYPDLLKSIVSPQKNISVEDTNNLASITAESTSTSISAILDLETVTKAALAISSEVKLDKLISNLMQVILENVGAEKAALILHKDEGMILTAYCQNYQQCDLLAIPINNAQNLPLSLINYVVNTKEDLLINDATVENNFVTDPYITQYQPKSILCSPILNQGELIGIIYLENTLATDVFTSERLKILKLLSSQAAISLENAQLYSSLEEKVAKRTQELNNKNLQLEQTLEELKLTQAQLIQTEKMSSLGQTVAGVAHEINNPINFIYANVEPAKNYFNDLIYLLELYREELPNPSHLIEKAIEEIDLNLIYQDVPEILKSMKNGAERIRNIVLSLRTFSGLDEADFKTVDIHKGIESTLVFLRSRMKDKLGKVEDIVMRDYGQLPLINCYASQLNQVFMNILNNAIDALYKHQKQLSIREKQEYSAKIIIRTQLVNDNWVRISIRDNGCGMNEEVRKRIFDYFYTTKDVGEGTGLGLSISYQIVVEIHQGKIECISQPGQGAEFLIDIPIKQ